MEELKKIKKMYGEDFMKLCRTLFPTLLEDEGKLYEILTSHFSNNSRTLYSDIQKNRLEEEFKNYIYSKIDVEHPEKIIIEEKTPYELLDDAGYNLIECTTEEEIQSFKKYYKPEEELCTFLGGRLERCCVFFAVRKDVENIKREKFDKPKREDEYGTSVMGIQFNKEGMCTVSIKNRYNHTVNNPDATYGNDLDRIIPGLTQSFGKLLKERGLELNNSNIEEFEIPGYVVANDGKYYKFNMEINGTYYCPGNVIVKNGEVNKIENPEKKILVDYFVLDLENKTIQLYDESVKDCFVDGLHDIEKIEIIKNEGKRLISIQQKEQSQPVIIGIDKEYQIIEYNNPNLTEVGDKFLKHNKGLTQLNLPDVKQVGDECLHYNESLIQINMQNVKKIGDNYLTYNKELTELDMPDVKQIGNDFLYTNKVLKQINIQNVKKIGDEFLYFNESLKKLDMPDVKWIGDSCLCNNNSLTQLDISSVMKVGEDFLGSNNVLQELKIPYISKQAVRLCKIAQKNRIKTKLDKDRQINEGEIKPQENIEVDELKFEQIYSKGKGKIKEAFSKIRTFLNTKSNDRNDKTNDDNIK